jgi:hypothetical protein
MKVLPAGADRTRLFVLLALLTVAAVAAWYMNRTPGTGVTTAAPPPTSNTAGATGQNGAPAGKPGQAGAGVSNTPQALLLAKLQEVPEEPTADRNPFRFGQRKIVQTPPLPPPPPAPVVQLPPPGPPPIPPVPLQLKSIAVLEPAQKNRAYLTDDKGTMFEGIEGQTIDGRYRLLKVTNNTAIVSYLDGTGQRSLMVR